MFRTDQAENVWVLQHQSKIVTSWSLICGWDNNEQHIQPLISYMGHLKGRPCMKQVPVHWMVMSLPLCRHNLFSIEGSDVSVLTLDLFYQNIIGNNGYNWTNNTRVADANTGSNLLFSDDTSNSTCRTQTIDRVLRDDLMNVMPTPALRKQIAGEEELSLMPWGGSSYNQRTCFRVFHQPVTEVIYRD